MADLLSRPGARDRSTHQAPGRKPVSLSAIVAAGACLLAGVLTCAAVAVSGWLAATWGGATAAVRAGAAVWLLAHKAPVALGSGPDAGTVGLAPLGLTLLAAAGLYRAGRFTARVSLADRTLDLAAACLCLAVAYGAGAAVVAGLTSEAGVRVSALAAFLGAGTIALLAGTAGVLVESGAAADLADATPDWLRDAVPAALAAVATVLAAAAALLAAGLAVNFSRSSALVAALDPGPVGATVLLAICVALLPNAVVYSAAFVAGQGFRLGTGTSVAPTGVELGNLPALPLLGAVPADGATPAYLLVLTAVVPLVAGVLAGLVAARRAGAVPGAAARPGWEGAALRAAVGAVLAGAALFALMVMAGGSAGPGRMADVGVVSPPASAGALTLGLALGAVPAAAVAARRRRD